VALSQSAYCSVEQLRTHLEDSSDLLSNELLERAIRSASRAVDKKTGRRFWLDSGVTERTYIANDQGLIFVDDIASRTGLIVATGTDGVTFPTVLAATDYVLEPRNADAYAATTFDPFAFWKIRRLSGSWTVDATRPTVQVTARHGWSAIPDEIVQATILKAAALFKRKDAPFGVAGFGEFGAVRITRSDPDVLDLISGYENAGIA
jgi:hypothetical protein